ncbi:MAG: hypothetical protein C0504_17740 [Candidatus Solibacter sp.]|nr:hypothetical protein [Candidatus Solibacter sp.]
MATSTNQLPGAAKLPARIAAPSWAARLSPSLFDLFLLAVLVWTFLSSAKDLGWSQMLTDGDSGWHMRVGQWVLEHGRVPTQDFFSFSKPGEAWFAWEWLSDVIYAVLHGWMGLKGMVWLTAALFMGLAGIMLLRVGRAGANVFLAVPLTMVGIGVIRIHLLARPHMFTLLFVAIAIWLIERDLKKPTRWIWALVPLTALWVNLHGGWAALVAILGIVSVGAAAEALAGRRDWQAAKRYAWLAAACGLASLANPYGWELHRHMFAYLDSKWIHDAVEEFQAPKFRSEGQRFFEMILLGAVLAAGVQMRRRRFIMPFLLLFWTHASLTSVRHAPILAIVALPVLAGGLAWLWNRTMGGFGGRSIAGILNSIGRDMQPSLVKPGVWSVVPMLFLLTPLAPVRWPSDFPSGTFPIEFVARHAAIIEPARLFAPDEWADYLLYRNYPRQRVFFDGRSDFYGERLGREFLRMMTGYYDWDKLLKKHEIDAVMVPPGTALASLLKSSPEWRLVADSGAENLFVLRGSRPENAAMTLMAANGTAEVNGGESE